MKKFHLFQFAFSALTLLAPFNLRSDTVSLPATADTFINNSFPDNNDGANAWFDVGSDNFLGVRRGLIRFDLSAIPAGSTVTSVVFQLQIAQAEKSAVN
jgi:hypothetical protein